MSRTLTSQFSKRTLIRMLTSLNMSISSRSSHIIRYKFNIAIAKKNSVIELVDLNTLMIFFLNNFLTIEYSLSTG